MGVAVRGEASGSGRARYAVSAGGPRIAAAPSGTAGGRLVGSIDRLPVQPLKPAFRGAYHTPEQLDRLKQATLDILENVGVQFQSEKALDLLAEHGVHVDRVTQVAKFPPAVVRDAMGKAPRRFALGALPIASRTTAGGNLATWVTRSTCTPCSASRSSAFSDWNCMPTFSRMSSVACLRRSSCSGV